MRGTLFQKPLEYKMQIDGESWRQGDSVAGSLIVKNHGGEPVLLKEAHVSLAYGTLKKVHIKDSDAFEILSSVPFAESERVAAGGEATLSWRFQLERNAPITDKSSSLFILYGSGKATPNLGQLELSIQPYRVIEDYLHRLNIDFRFVVKAMKFSKGKVEVKLTPPAGQLFATLDHLMLYFHFEGESMQVRYVFNVKKIESTASAFDIKKAKKEFIQTYAPSQFGHEPFEAGIKNALGTVEAKILF